MQKLSEPEYAEDAMFFCDFGRFCVILPDKFSLCKFHVNISQPFAMETHVLFLIYSYRISLEFCMSFQKMNNTHQ